MNKQKRILVRDGVELSALYFPLLAITPLIEETSLFSSLNLAVFSGIYGSTTPKPLEVFQRIFLPVICGGILLMVFCLVIIMPSWESIYQSVY